FRKKLHSAIGCECVDVGWPGLTVRARGIDGDKGVLRICGNSGRLFGAKVDALQRSKRTYIGPLGCRTTGDRSRRWIHRTRVCMVELRAHRPSLQNRKVDKTDPLFQRTCKKTRTIGRKKIGAINGAVLISATGRLDKN